MTTRTIAVVSAGLSTPSATRLLADRLADATSAALRERGDDAVVEIIELREHAHDLTNNLLTSFASERLQAAKDTVTGADALIAVTPIFSTSYTGLFKMFFDLLDDDALADTPVLIGATAGTARHSLALDYALRPLFTYLRAVVVPTGVFAASDDWGSGAAADGGLTSRIERAAAQLAALAQARRDQPVADPFEDPVPFEQLLRDSTN
ncbi:MAG: FMN reductase [Actinomycetota bacterium]